MKAVLFGTGMMGRAAAYDLVRNPEVEKVKILDQNSDAVAALAKKLDSFKIEKGIIDVNDFSAAVLAMKGYNCALSCVPYNFNYALAKAAITSECNFLDLGGNNEIVQRELSLCEEAEKQKVLIVPDCGLAPGLSSVLVKKIVEEFDQTYTIHVRVGGLPQHPQPPFNYALAFSVQGLVNEYVGSCIALREGKIATIPPMEELETIEFYPYGTLEAFTTSGGISTLPSTFEGMIKTLDYKTIRYPGHCEQFKRLQKEAGNRDTLEKMLIKILPRGKEDVVMMLVTGEGIKDNRLCRITYQLIDKYDSYTGLTAMMRATAFPATILMSMISTGKIDLKGAYTQEHFSPAEEIIDELAKRQVVITRKEDKI